MLSPTGTTTHALAALPADVRLGATEPRQAVAAFQARGLLRPTFRWTDVWQEEHAVSFMVAGVDQLGVLGTIRQSLAEALGKGTSFRDWASEIRPFMARKGWWGDVEITDPTTGELRTTRFNDARLQLIYDVNLRQSYAAGRWADIERGRARRPLLMYRTMRDERVRVSHAAWHGVTLPIDHPFWRDHYPPNGWRCRCRAIPVSERDVERMQAAGQRVLRQAPPEQTIRYRDPRTGAETEGPVGIDPGWSYNPGQARMRAAGDLLTREVEAADPRDARAVLGQMLTQQGAERFARAPLPNQVLPVGLLPQSAATARMRPGSPAVQLPGDVMQRATAAGGVVYTDLVLLQQLLDEGERYTAGRGEWLYVLPRADGSQLVARLQLAPPDRLPRITDLRRLSASQAAADEELARLRAAGARPGG